MSDPHPARPDDAEARLNARFDEELAPPDAAALDADIASDPALRASWDGWRTDLARLDDLLRPAEAARPDDAIDRALAAIDRSRAPRVPRWPVLALPFAAAAGFALAMLVAPARERIVERTVERVVERPVERIVERIVERTVTAPLPPEAMGRVALVTGSVEHCAPGNSTWTAAPPGTPLAPGSRVRTGTAHKATIAFTDGTEVRLNAATELACKSPRALELAEGELWAHVAADRGTPFVVATPRGSVTVTGTEISLVASADATRLAVISGSARLADRGGREVDVPAQHVASVDGERLGEPERAYALERGTRWMVELLYLKGKDDPELARKVDAMLAQIGETKMQHLSEAEIRGLGYACTLPLARHLQATATRHAELATRRRSAARILADIAGIDVLPDLIDLIADPDAVVREAAARGTCRLRGNLTAGATALEVARWTTADEAARKAHHRDLWEELTPLLGAAEPRSWPADGKR